MARRVSQYGQIRKKLSHMQKTSDGTTCAVWSTKTLADTTAKVVEHINGLCNRTAVVKRMQYNTHSSRKTDLKEVLDPFQRRHWYTRVGLAIYLTLLVSTRFTANDYLQLKTIVLTITLELCLQLTRNRAKVVKWVSPSDGRTNGKEESRDGTLSSELRQLPAGWLERLSPNEGVLWKQSIPKDNRLITVLCKLRIPLQKTGRSVSNQWTGGHPWPNFG